MPLIAALVKTFVVSWKDAEDIKLSVLRAALVSPKRTGLPLAGEPPASSYLLFSSSNSYLSTYCPTIYLVFHQANKFEVPNLL